jgi:hypothetical protein
LRDRAGELATDFFNCGRSHGRKREMSRQLSNDIKGRLLKPIPENAKYDETNWWYEVTIKERRSILSRRLYESCPQTKETRVLKRKNKKKEEKMNKKQTKEKRVLERKNKKKEEKMNKKQKLS